MICSKKRSQWKVILIKFSFLIYFLFSLSIFFARFESHLSTKNDFFLNFFFTVDSITGKCSSTTELTLDRHCSPVMIECSSSGYDICSGSCLMSIVTKYSEKIILTESDAKPRTSRRKEKLKIPANAKCKDKVDCSSEWQGPPPWDPSIGGDGYPKFLCDVMVGSPDLVTPNSCTIHNFFYYHSAVDKMNLGLTKT